MLRSLSASDGRVAVAPSRIVPVDPPCSEEGVQDGSNQSTDVHQNRGDPAWCGSACSMRCAGCNAIDNQSGDDSAGGNAGRGTADNCTSAGGCRCSGTGP